MTCPAAGLFIAIERDEVNRFEDVAREGIASLGQRAAQVFIEAGKSGRDTGPLLADLLAILERECERMDVAA